MNVCSECNAQSSNGFVSFSNRHERDLCKNCLDGLLAERSDAVPAPELVVETPPNGVYAAALSSIERERVEWLWPGRIPYGMLTLLIGDPGLGKSSLGVQVAAEVSKQGGDVLLLSAEDHAGATIRPRAEAAQADLDHIHVVRLRREGLEEGLVLPEDAAELSRIADETNARLLVLDPLMAHLGGGVNSWSDQDMRAALRPLHRLAEQSGCAVVVIAHLNKARGGNPLYRAGGSIGIPAAVRSALLLARDPEDPEGERGSKRVLAHIKCNVGEQAESLSCVVEAVELDGADGLVAPRFRIIGASAISGSELLDAPYGEERDDRDEATEFLRAELAPGAQPANEVKRKAEQTGIGPGSLKRAKRSLGVESTKQGMDGPWLWELPEEDAPKGTASVSIYPSPSSPSHSQAKNRGPEGEEGDEGDGSGDSDPFSGDPCRYRSHRGSDWVNAAGRKVCGRCHPKAAA